MNIWGALACAPLSKTTPHKKQNLVTVEHTTTVTLRRARWHGTLKFLGMSCVVM